MKPHPIFWVFVGCLLFWLLVGVAIAHGETELKAVAVTIAGEAANQGEEGMRAVACVIANRGRAWGKTPYGVVTQPNQFYGYTAKNRMRRYEEVREIADRLAGEVMELKDITGGALYFRRVDEPVFAWCKVYCVQIGDHVFYK